MATVKDILKEKGEMVYSISPQASALEAAVSMNDHKIGALAVLDQGRLKGMFTERDMLRRVVALERAPREVKVADVMTTEVVYAHPDTTVEEARTLMKRMRVRHLPIINEQDQIQGLISQGDLNAYKLAEEVRVVESLQMYLYERV